MSEAIFEGWPEDEAMEIEGEEGFQEVAVLDDASAEYMLRRIREAEEQYEKMEAWYENQKAKAKAVRDRTVTWAEMNLRSYFDMVPTKNSKTQRSYELPGGKMVLKEQQPKYDQQDELLVPWLKKNGMSEMVKTVETSDWAELKKHLKPGPDGTMVTEDGEIVPGVTATPREPKFTVTINRKERW